MYTFSELVMRVREPKTEISALQDLQFTCARCDQLHHGMSDLSIDAPTPYKRATSEEREIFQLNEDLCRNSATGDCFVRGVLPLAIIGTDAVFTYGVWSTLSHDNFQTYVKTFKEDQAGLGPWFGWFSNALNGYPQTTNLKLMVHPQPNGKRPIFELDQSDHPLAREQHDGITVERLLEIYAANGHGPMAPIADEAEQASRKPRWWPFG